MTSMYLTYTYIQSILLTILIMTGLHVTDLRAVRGHSRGGGDYSYNDYYEEVCYVIL